MIDDLNVGELCYKVFSTEEGQVLLGWMYNQWVTGPQQARAFNPNPSFDHGRISYEMGKADAFYVLKGLADDHVAKLI